MVQGKNQHYVSQFYFRQFSSDGKSVYMYNLKRNLCRSVKFKDQCSKNYFYSKNPKIEETFSHLEGLSAASLQKIIKSKSLFNLSSDELNHLKSHILFQDGRTKTSGDVATEMANCLFNVLKPDILKKLRVW